MIFACRLSPWYTDTINLISYFIMRKTSFMIVAVKFSNHLKQMKLSHLLIEYSINLYSKLGKFILFCFDNMINWLTNNLFYDKHHVDKFFIIFLNFLQLSTQIQYLSRIFYHIKAIISIMRPYYHDLHTVDWS